MGPKKPEPEAAAWHGVSVDHTVERLATDRRSGLEQDEAERRLSEHGPNLLEQRASRSPLVILLEQFTSTMIVVLIVAAVISGLLGDLLEAGAILAIVLLNGVLGFVQEYRAERAVEALQEMARPQATVRRGGRVLEVASRDLVPGDVVLLEAGGHVPADLRLTQTALLRAQEAALTGESEPVEKSTAPLADAGLALGDRTNLAFMGTNVAYGRGEGIAVATGMNTQLGMIADMVQTVERVDTPLQRRLARLARLLAAAALALVILIFTLGVVRGEDFRLMFMTAVSMAVAAVPEGLPAVVTIALALGARKMLSRHALIRRLPAVETLGSVTIICADKTGTLTENRMRVGTVELPDGREFQRVAPEHGGDAAELLMLAAVLCNDADLGEEGPAHGDPTEVALLAAGANRGILRAELEERLPRVSEVPFESSRKRMTTVHRLPADLAVLPLGMSALAPALEICPSGLLLATKGAVEQVLAASRFILAGGDLVELDDEWRERVAAADDGLADNGFRSLGLALRAVPDGGLSEDGHEDPEHDLVFLGLAGLLDPARKEAGPAVGRSKAAGIRPVMITGDHPLTARRIAVDLAIADEDAEVVSGRAIAQMDLEELADRAESTGVFARVSPEDKLSIVTALQRRGHVVAMTGDGVNDAPALRRADIGVAMGITGTDVAKESAEMVLLDDNFATIVAAIEEGRVIYDNIRKFLRYLLTGNSAELTVMVAALALGLPLPLLPLQILWINLVTDGPPALALAVEPGEPDTMSRPPRPPDSRILDSSLAVSILTIGILVGLISLAAGYLFGSEDETHRRSIIFTTLTFAQVFFALSVRSEKGSFFRRPGGNPWLLAAVLITLALQFLVIYLPPAQNIFGTVPLSASELTVVILAGSSAFWLAELEKLVRRLL